MFRQRSAERFSRDGVPALQATILARGYEHLPERAERNDSDWSLMRYSDAVSTGGELPQLHQAVFLSRQNGLAVGAEAGEMNGRSMGQTQPYLVARRGFPAVNVTVAGGG